MWRKLTTYTRRVPGPVAEYGLAVLSSGVMLALSLLLAPIGGDDSIPGVLFLGGVGLSGWYGGVGPALLATACGALALDYFFEAPPFLVEITNVRTVAYLISFLLMSLLLGSLNARLRASNRRLRTEVERAEAAVVARDDLIATVSHDLQTPLTAIKTSVYSLRDRVVDVPPDTRDRLLGNIESEADRLVHFVSGALAMRRLENGPVPRRELLSPCEVVSAALDRCAPALGDRPLEFDVPDDLPPLRIDPALFDQALTALFENVAAHTPPRTRLAVNGTVHDGALDLSISDSGPGVPVEARERIFEKYERLDLTGSGLGLGLAIARAAIEAQGGRIHVEDCRLGGACFRIVIPSVLQTERR